jgi:uncharacterized protein YndB with AHSA1/START domain
MTQSQAEAIYEINEARHSVNLTRDLSISAEQAFAFWTEPRHVEQWWDASGAKLIKCEIDLRVGGTLHFVSPRPEAPPFVGRYLQIDPPNRLVFEALGATGTVSIVRTGTGSRVDVEIRAPNAEALKAMLAVGVAVGTAQTLDNLRAYAKMESNVEVSGSLRSAVISQGEKR